MEVVAEIVFELLLEIVLEFLVSLGWEALSARRQRGGGLHPALAAIGFVFVGLLLGALSAWLVPQRLVDSDRLALLSVLVNPCLVGLALQLFGDRRRRAGRTTTRLATFWGGACFSLGIGVGRFALLVAL